MENTVYLLVGIVIGFLIRIGRVAILADKIAELKHTYYERGRIAGIRETLSWSRNKHHGR